MTHQLVSILVPLSDSSSFDIRISIMTDDLQIGHFCNMQSLSLELQLNVSIMQWEFVGKICHTFFFVCLVLLQEDNNFRIFRKSKMYMECCYYTNIPCEVLGSHKAARTLVVNLISSRYLRLYHQRPQ